MNKDPRNLKVIANFKAATIKVDTIVMATIEV